MKNSLSKIKNLIERIRNSTQQQFTSETNEAINGTTLRSLSNDDLSITGRRRKYYMQCPIQDQSSKKRFQNAKIKLKGFKLWSAINQEVKNFGTNSNLFDAYEAYRQNLGSVMKSKKRIIKNSEESELRLGCLFHPDSGFKTYWHFLILLAIIYVVTGMPLVLAFMDASPGTNLFIFETIIDFIFFLDILVNFNSAFINNHGELELDRKKIIVNYLTGFFFLDFVSIFPFWYLSDAESNKTSHLTRMIRLTKLTRIFRVSKIIPIIRSVVDSKSMSKILDFFLNYQGATRLVTIIYTMLIIVHCISCIWYLIADLNGIFPDTWVARLNVDRDSYEVLYLRGIYFAFTVATTVGFGDITPYRTEEIAVVIIIMMFGVCLYSFLVATLTSILSSIDENTLRLNSKKNILDELREIHKISVGLKRKISQYIKVTKHGDVSSFIETISKLPKKLQVYLTMSMFHAAPINIDFLKNNDEQLIVELIPNLQMRYYQELDVVYLKDTLPFEFYMISKGRVSYIFGENRIEIKVFPAGSYFGDVELSKHCPRKYTAVAQCYSEILTVSNKILTKLLNRYPKVSKKFHHKADVQEYRDTESLFDIIDILEFTQVSKEYKLSDLAGQKKVVGKRVRNRPKYSTLFFRKSMQFNKNISENNSKVNLYLELKEIRGIVENIGELINKVLK